MKPSVELTLLNPDGTDATTRTLSPGDLLTTTVRFTDDTGQLTLEVKTNVRVDAINGRRSKREKAPRSQLRVSA